MSFLTIDPAALLEVTRFDLHAPDGFLSVPVSLAMWALTAAVLALYDQPFMDLVYSAQRIHRQHFAPNTVQLSALLSVKTGGCPEDCGYCPQSARYQTGVGAEKLMCTDDIVEAAQ